LLGTELVKTEIFKDYSNKDLIKEEESLRFSLLENPQDIEKLRELAIVLYNKKDYSGAINLYEKLAKIKSEDPDIFAFLGYLYYEEEDYAKSIENYEIALEIDPGRSFIYFLLGNSYSRAGLIKDAINSYDFAIFLDLDIYTAHLDFAKKYEAIGQKEKALKEYVIAYEIDPRDKKIAEDIARLKSELGKN
jgi:tetratricopeptide (TPR) repeat protein